VSSDEGVLLIDLDGTLLDREAGFRRWADGFLRRLGRYTPDDLAWIVDLDGSGLTPRERLFGGIRRRYGLAESVAALIDAYYEEFLPLIPPPSRDDLAALAAARIAGWKLCIVTNGGAQAQVPKISPQLAAAVDGSVISEIVGVEKPDPRILQAAAAAVGQRLTPTSWMIGDRHETDVLGAVRAGIRSAWITQGRDWDGSLPYRPDLEAVTFADAMTEILVSSRDVLRPPSSSS
jgi:putative hydrolase of the HAD superfamily